MSTYDRRGFASAYADVQNDRIPGVDGERVGYAPALGEYRTALLKGLERLFGLRLESETVPRAMLPVFTAFRSTVRSYGAITGPMDGYLEAGLIHIRLREAGVHESFLAGVRRIDECNTASADAHLDILEALLGVLLGDSADRVVSAEELHAIGVGTTPPSPYDYEW